MYRMKCLQDRRCLGPAAVPLAIASSAVSAFGEIKRGRADKRAADANAAIAVEDAALEERALRIRTDKLLSAQRAAAGASGIALEGSARLVMEETAREAEFEALMIRRRGGQFAAAERAKGKAAAIGGVLGAGARLLGGASAIAGQISGGPAPPRRDAAGRVLGGV